MHIAHAVRTDLASSRGAENTNVRWPCKQNQAQPLPTPNSLLSSLPPPPMSPPTDLGHAVEGEAEPKQRTGRTCRAAGRETSSVGTG